jgi:DNA gyrase inhibitor GyrI
MSEHDKEKMVLAVVTPEAWQDFYAVMDSLNEQIAAWAMKHDLPPAVMVGASWALASTVDHFADLCSCDACRAVEVAFVDEVMKRVTAAESEIGQAVH